MGISQTDNVFLAPRGEEVEDTFWQASPFLRWSKESKTLDGLVDYRYDRFEYSDLDITQSWHFLNSSLTGKAWDESLQLQVGASRRQVLENPEEDILPGRALPSGNLIDLDQWFIAPSFNRAIAGATTLMLAYRYTESEYDLGFEQGDVTQDAQFRLDNYTAGQGLTWALKYNHIRTDYEVAIPFEYNYAGAELGFWTGTSTRLFAGAGRESQWDDPIDRSPKDPFWEAGFAYQAGENLQAEFAAGQRSFGDSMRGSLNYVFRRGSMRISYLEQPSTEGFNRRRGGNPIVPENPDDFLTDPGRAERFITNRFDTDLTIDGRRSQFRVQVFSEERTGRFAADGTQLPDQDQRGLTARFSWQAGTRTEFVIGGSLVDRDLDDQGADEFAQANAAINYSLGTRTRLSLSHRYSDQQPTDNGTTRQFTANVTTLMLTLSTQ